MSLEAFPSFLPACFHSCSSLFIQEPFEFRRVPSSYDARYRRVDASLPEQSLPDVVRGVGNGRHFFYVLVAYNRKSSKSLEAGIKYLVFGALSSSLLLLGIVLLYGVGASPEAWGASYPGYESMDPLAFQYLGNLLEENSDNLLLRTGVVLIVAGIAFKVGRPLFRFGFPTCITVPLYLLLLFWPCPQRLLVFLSF